jgi:hypothetical protein
VIWRRREGDTFRYGLNWDRDRRTHIEINLFWRGWGYLYRLGIRIRKRAYGNMLIPRWRRMRLPVGRVMSRGSSCEFYDYHAYRCSLGEGCRDRCRP